MHELRKFQMEEERALAHLHASEGNLYDKNEFVEKESDDAARDQVKTRKTNEISVERVAREHKLLVARDRALLFAKQVNSRNRLQRPNTARSIQEAVRYKQALRHQILQQLKKKDVELPQLCNCGLSVDNDDTSKCANNCPFYNNPKAYDAALTTMLDTFV